jgi:hypothetical protein
MGIHAFRAMISLSVPAEGGAAAQTVAAGIAEALSQVRYGKGVVSVRMGAPGSEVSLDPLGSGYTCRLDGHVSVQADAQENARDLAFRWKRLVQENLSRHHGLSFPRFDLHPR